MLLICDLKMKGCSVLIRIFCFIYSVLRWNTSRRRSGGVCINGKEVEIKLHDKSTGACAAITLLINPSEHQCFITVVYHLPGLTIDDCQCVINSLISVRSKVKSCSWSILGDFNLYEVQYEFPFRRCMSGHSVQQNV